MKKIRYCRITILILISWIVLSVMGYLGKDTIYRQYTIDVRKTPYFVLVLQGIHDGIYPWSSERESIWEQKFLVPKLPEPKPQRQPGMKQEQKV